MKSIDQEIKKFIIGIFADYTKILLKLKCDNPNLSKKAYFSKLWDIAFDKYKILNATHDEELKEYIISTISKRNFGFASYFVFALAGLKASICVKLSRNEILGVIEIVYLEALKRFPN